MPLRLIRLRTGVTVVPTRAARSFLTILLWILFLQITRLRHVDLLLFDIEDAQVAHIVDEQRC